jgi:hypothetical protein
MTVHWPGAMQDHLLARGCPRTRQVSPENPTGHRNEGARAVPDPDDPDLPHSAMAARLGRGFKVRPFISLAAGERRTIAALEGAGVITGRYLTSNLPDLRDLRLRIWWDGDAAAAVDVTVASFLLPRRSWPEPLGDLRHDQRRAGPRLLQRLGHALPAGRAPGTGEHRSGARRCGRLQGDVSGARSAGGAGLPVPRIDSERCPGSQHRRVHAARGAGRGHDHRDLGVLAGHWPPLVGGGRGQGLPGR